MGCQFCMGCTLRPSLAARLGKCRWWVTQLVYTAPGGLPDLLLSWPPLQLVCGDWPTDDRAVPAVAWWDRTGLTPLVATLGHIDLLAMMQIVQRDLMRSA